MEKRKIVFYLTIGMILILHLTACTNRSSELPAPDSTVFGYEGETKIIFDGVCAKYNDKKEKNQVFLPIVQVLGTYEEGNITKIVSCVSLTEMSLEEGNLTIAGTNIFPMVTEIKYENEEYEVINLNSAETVLANGSASFPEVFLLICGPLEDVKQDIENRTFALPEMEKTKSREREYIEWSNVNVETKYDWFANEYKDTEYKISSIIAAEKQNIQAQAECSANEDSVVSAAPAEDEMVAEVLANASFARMYNKENAWKYAYTYATSTTTSTANSYYNTDIFNDYSGPDAGDCMNFASQAIYAGFSGSNNLTSVNAGTAPQDTVGIAAGQPNAAQTKWYAKPASTYWAWTSCGYFRDYIDYSVTDTETRLRAVKKTITASSDFSEVGTANLIGSIIHVNGNKPLGHAVIVNNATGTARNQIYFTAHSPNAKNLNLAEEYSGQMVSIRPTYFYDVTTCTGANTSHTFSSTNSKCARCGYVRTYIIPTLLTPMAKNTQITLTARTNHTVSSISMSVKNPNGATTNLGTVTNTNSISKVYTPTVAAHPNDLYTVTVTAVSADGVTTSSTWTFRTY